MLEQRQAILPYGKNNIGISNKITDRVRREEISKLFNVYKNDAYGFVIRTSASEQNDEYLIQEIELLKKKYNEIVDKANFSTCFSCIYKNYDEFICDIKEMIDKNVEEIVIEDDNLYGIVLDILPCINKGFNINLRHYIDKTLSLVKLYSVEANIAGLLKERVWLKSGANIVIQHTEALTVIDVNTSKSIKVKGNYADTFLKINKEAAKEIANQLSLRNIGGIIIIDFIDMKREEDKSELINYLQKYLYMDYIKTVFVDMTKLNLVEITRKKVKSPLSKQVKEIYNVLEKYK